MTTESELRWLDFSGAPALLVPTILAALWRGTIDPSTGDHRDCNPDYPVTDYDRACAVCWPGKGILELAGTPILVFYSEYDHHSWDSSRLLYVSPIIPSDEDLRNAKWSDPIRWRAEHTDYVLMNSAADAKQGLKVDDFIPVQLQPGIYTVTYADTSSEYCGCAYRLLRDATGPY